MSVMDSFPYQVREIENVFIPMRDGAQLAARIWLPEEAERARRGGRDRVPGSTPREPRAQGGRGGAVGRPAGVGPPGP